MVWQLIILMLGSAGSVVALTLNETKGSLKKWLISISCIFIFCGAIFSTIYITRENDEKQEDKRNLNSSFNTTFAKLDTTLIKSNFLLDSLREVKEQINLIMDSTKRELQIQRHATLTTENILGKSRELLISQNFIAKKSRQILDKQEYLFNTSNRILYPFFPVTFSIDVELSFTDTGIQSFTKYLYNLKSKLQNEGIPELENDRRYGSIWTTVGPGGGIYLLPFNYEYISDSAFSFEHFLDFNFEISLIKGTEDDARLKNTNVPQLHFCIGSDVGDKKPEVLVLVNYEEKKITFRTRYFNYEFKRCWFHQSNATFGADELEGIYLTISYLSFSKFSPKISRIWFPSIKTNQKPLVIYFNEKDVFEQKYSFYGKGYLHKISKKDFRSADEFFLF